MANPLPLAPEATIRIAIIDDHPLVRHGLQQLISTQPDMQVCGEAASYSDGLRLVEATLPHLAIVDLSLLEGSGLELIKEIRQRFPGVKVLVSSVYDEAVYAERTLRAGASGYVNKTHATRDVLHAIRHVLGGSIYVSPALADRLLQLAASGNGEMASNPLDRLSDRELQVFKMIGQGLTTAQVAEKLFLSPKTVNTYRDNIKAKLNLGNASELTYHAVQWVLQNS